MAVAAVVLAFLASQVSPAWTTRYFAAVVGPFALLAAGALARAGGLGLVALALVAALWFGPPTRRVNNKSDVHRVANVLAGPPARVHPGDLVVSTHPSRCPSCTSTSRRACAGPTGWARSTTPP